MAELTVFIGYDGREKVAYDVCKHSIEMHTTSDIKIIPLYHKQLRQQGFFVRPWLTGGMDGNHQDLIDQRPFSTEFSHTRFLVPALMKFKGWALFMDCDMVARCNIKEVFAHCDNRYAVMCVKHNQKVNNGQKMDGTPQHQYYRKNWSSFVLWNCGHPKNAQLKKEIVNTSTGSWLHGFSWLDDKDIGALPDYYNWIEGTSRSDIQPRIIHYTLGGPWFSSYKDVMFSETWWDYYKSYSKDLPDPSDAILEVDYHNV